MDKYLPIGSVILLKEGKKILMIYGVDQKEDTIGKVWNYIGCLFPEGNIDAEHTYVFNHDQIDRIFYIGMQDEEQMEFNRECKIKCVSYKKLTHFVHYTGCVKIKSKGM